MHPASDPSHLGTAPETARVTSMTQRSERPTVWPATVKAHQRSPLADAGVWCVQAVFPQPARAARSSRIRTGGDTPAGRDRGYGRGTTDGPQASHSGPTSAAPSAIQRRTDSIIGAAPVAKAFRANAVPTQEAVQTLALEARLGRRARDVPTERRQ